MVQPYMSGKIHQGWRRTRVPGELIKETVMPQNGEDSQNGKTNAEGTELYKRTYVIGLDIIQYTAY